MSWFTVTLTAAVLSFSLFLPVPQPPATAAAPENGPLLHGGPDRGLRGVDGTPIQHLPFGLGSVAEFSPDGTKIAVARTICAGAGCRAPLTSVTVFGSDETESATATVDGRATSLTWAPDQSAVAVLVGTNRDDAIYRLPVDGTAPSMVVGSSPTLRLVASHISWRPGGTTIAFIASETEADGSGPARDFSQIYTVPATGGAPTRYNAHLTDSACAHRGCRDLEFADPAWAPDGSSLAAHVVDTHEDFATGDTEVEQYVGRVRPGGSHPTVLKLLRTDVNPTSLHLVARRPLVWSESGTRLLYAYANDHRGVRAGIVTIGTGAVTPLGTGGYLDWQPCPAGTCAAWR